ncbi:hypothetical protein SAMN02746041_03283 [Desulfacinum hydrothermale DSM 13146]|uniref:Uncharacterized protein n=1 Tax=Desulfacinum hydrothermale DSM 13146 TaxID=1121390 RepID=A0A1W1XYJ9_9BACT|nr:hypothetical protein SAMN02746041_03283 [Desulfacinum hydrothermale DSM 13146]
MQSLVRSIIVFGICGLVAIMAAIMLQYGDVYGFIVSHLKWIVSLTLWGSSSSAFLVHYRPVLACILSILAIVPLLW